MDPGRLLGRDPEGVDQAAHFPPRIPDRFARLQAEALREFLAPLPEAGHAVIEHLLPGVGGQGRHGWCGRGGRGDRPVDRGLIGQRDPGDEVAGVLVEDVQIGVRLFGPVADPERVLFPVDIEAHGALPTG